MNKSMVSVIGSISFAVITSSVLADPSYSPTTGDHWKHHGAWSNHDKSAFSMPSERVEARLAYIKTALMITDAQNPQWETFADMERKQAQADDKKIQEWQEKMRQYYKDQGESGSGGEHEDGHLSAIDRMEQREKHLNDSVTRLGAKIAALRPLYSVLSEEQKRIADEVLADRHGHHRGWDRGMFEHTNFHESLLIDLHRLVQI